MPISDDYTPLSDDDYVRLSLLARDTAINLGCPPALAVPGNILFGKIGSGWHVYAGSWFYSGMVAVGEVSLPAAIVKAHEQSVMIASMPAEARSAP